VTLALLDFGNIGAHPHQACDSAVLVECRGGSRQQRHRCAIAAPHHALAAPVLPAAEQRANIRRGQGGGARSQQVAQVAAHGLGGGPAIDALGRGVPVGHAPVHIGGHHRLGHRPQQVGLHGQQLRIAPPVGSDARVAHFARDGGDQPGQVVLGDEISCAGAHQRHGRFFADFAG
jgi:hypothetical protein